MSSAATTTSDAAMADAEATAVPAPAPDGASDGSPDAKVHAADTYDRGALRWGYFLLLNAIAGSIAVAMFVGVFYADALDPYLQGTYQWLLAHPGVTSMAAFSPLACSLLVGYGYASRARKRRQAAAKRAELVEQARAQRKTARAGAAA